MKAVGVGSGGLVVGSGVIIGVRSPLPEPDDDAASLSSLSIRVRCRARSSKLSPCSGLGERRSSLLAGQACSGRPKQHVFAHL